jgi:hypothetical protein
MRALFRNETGRAQLSCMFLGKSAALPAGFFGFRDVKRAI